MTGLSTCAWWAIAAAAPEEELERMLGLFRDKYADFTVKHFHEQLQKRHGYVLGYTVTKLALHAAGLVRRRRSVRRTARSAHAGRFRACCCIRRIAPRLDRRPAGDGPDRDDGRCDE